jgi:cyanophycinase
VITDTHFSARSRLGRLIVFVALLNERERDSGVVGIGIDEKTALLVDADGSGRLAPDSRGNAWLVQQRKAATVLRPGQPLTLAHVHVTRLDASSSIDLRSKRVRGASAPANVDIVKGHPSTAPALQNMMLREHVPADES